MKLFNYKIINYKRFSVFLVLFSLIVGSVSILFEKPRITNAFSPNQFVTTWKTDNPGVSGPNQITIPTAIGILDDNGFPVAYVYNYDVDCDLANPGTNVLTGQTGDATCTYASPGTYQIAITGQFPRIYFNNSGDKLKILSIDQWGTNLWGGSMSFAFYGAANMTLNAVDAPDLSNTAWFSGMFRDCTSLTTNPALNSWDMSNAVSIASMFFGATSFNQDISSWNTGNVITFNSAFRGATSFNQNISSWNTANVTDMYAMFFGATSFNQDISSWNTANVTDMSYMFHSADSFNQDISSWNTANVTNMERMFAQTDLFNQPLNLWNVGNVTNMEAMFAFADLFNQPLNLWNVGNVTKMRAMFRGATSFNQDISSWNTANVTDMYAMFRDAIVFNQDISLWNTANVTDMSYMFQSANSFNQNISSWNTGNVTNMEHMFTNADVFNQPIGVWNVAAVTNMEAMFTSADVFNQPLNSWNVGNVTKMGGMFRGANMFDQNISSWDVADVTDMTHIFSNTALSIDNYDAILISWNGQSLQPAVPFGADTRKYCFGESARQNMITADGWTITDAGKDCSGYTLSTPDLITADDTGVSNTDNITTVATPTFDVLCFQAGDIATIYVDGTANGTHTCTGAGTESVPTLSIIPDGVHAITYTITRGGTETDPSLSLSVMIDANAPTMTLTATSSSVSGPFTVTITPGEPVFGLTLSDMVVTNGTASNLAGPDGSGNYTVTITPTNTGTITISIPAASVTDGIGNTSSASNTLSLNYAAPSGGGSSGGCLPGYPCSNNGPTSPSTPVTPSTPVPSTPAPQNPVLEINQACPFSQYLKRGMTDGKNGISEVSKVQSFLNKKLGLNLPIDGIFGSKTYTAVRTFQSTYFDQILAPWGLTGPTGWWYQSTRSYANYLENCSEGTVPLDNGVRIQDGRIVN